MKSGIYTITNKITGQQYIGSTKDLENRQKEHFRLLRLDRHINVWLQHSFSKHGEEAFCFNVLEYCLTEELFTRERCRIDEAKARGQILYNIGAVGGGDNLSNHPNREGIIEKRSKKMRGKKREPKFGEDNPHWKGGRPKCSKCGKFLFYHDRGVSTCNGCRDRNGDRNPFYGKTHTVATKEKLRQAFLGKKPSNARKIIIDGVEYLSMNDAASELNLVPATVSHRVRSRNFPNYVYA